MLESGEVGWACNSVTVSTFIVVMVTPVPTNIPVGGAASWLWESHPAAGLEGL